MTKQASARNAAEDVKNAADATEELRSLPR
jgi:hypothetical protein